MSKKEFPSEKDLDQKPKEDLKHKEIKIASSKADKDTQKVGEDLAKEIERLKAAKAELEDKYLRNEAEIQNMQDRYDKECAQLIRYESQSLTKDILSAVDNLQRALNVKVDDGAPEQLKKGVEMTLDVMVKAMADHGITEIKAEGAKSDPNLHQAVQTTVAENDEQKDHVVQVLRAGYQYKDRTLRPAMVTVTQ